MSDRADLREEILTLLTRGKPQRLIAVGTLARSLLQPYAEAADSQLIALDVAPELPALDQLPADLALLAGELGALSAAESSVLLGRLRDLYARRIWVLLQKDAAGLEHRDLMGHGFSRVGAFELDGKPVQLYEFDIGTYKTTPDWLSSKNWANPQLFDKYRW